MATIILRNHNSTNFEVQNVDLATDEIKIINNLNIANDKLYYFNPRYVNSVRDVRITSSTFREAYFGTDHFVIGDNQLEMLMATGHCEAVPRYGSDRCQVYVGKFFEPIAKEMGAKSLARCYAEIETKREAYRKVRNIQATLLAIADGVPIKHVECDIDTLAGDIETFLKNRKKCLDALKPKKRK